MSITKPCEFSGCNFNSIAKAEHCWQHVKNKKSYLSRLESLARKEC